MGRTTKEIRKRIEFKEEKLNRELTKEEKDKIVRSVKRKVRRENFIRGAFLALGITLGAGGHALLTAGGNKTDEVNRQEAESQIDLNKQEHKIEFKEGLVVNIDTSNQVNKEQKIKENVKTEIESLKTSQEVLEYLKDIYVEEYNKTGKEEIEKEQVKFYKSRADKEIYEDIAENGDKIVKVKYSAGNNLNTKTGVISAYIENEDGRVIEKMTKSDGKYQTVYNDGDQVEKYENNSLIDIGAVLDSGIDWSVAMEQEGNSYTINEEYKNRFVDATAQYMLSRENADMQQTSEIEER